MADINNLTALVIAPYDDTIRYFARRMRLLVGTGMNEKKCRADAEAASSGVGNSEMKLTVTRSPGPGAITV
jgi:hypothetical protein